MQIMKGTKYQICLLCQFYTSIKQLLQDQELSQVEIGGLLVCQSRKVRDVYETVVKKTSERYHWLHD